MANNQSFRSNRKPTAREERVRISKCCKRRRVGQSVLAAEISDQLLRHSLWDFGLPPHWVMRSGRILDELKMAGDIVRFWLQEVTKGQKHHSAGSTNFEDRFDEQQKIGTLRCLESFVPERVLKLEPLISP